MLPLALCFSMVSFARACSNAFVTLLTNGAYFPGTASILATLRRKFHSVLPFFIFVPSDKADLCRQAGVLRNLQGTVLPLDPISSPYPARESRFDNSGVFLKLYLFGLVQFSKVLYIDSDQLLMKDPSTLFKYEPFAASYKHKPGFIWGSRQVSELKTSTMLIRPSCAVFHMLITKLGHLPSSDGADQGFLNSVFFKQWEQASRRHPGKHVLPALNAPAIHTLGALLGSTRSNFSDLGGIDFSGVRKPWNSDDQAEVPANASWYLRAFRLWHKNFNDTLGFPLSTQWTVQQIVRNIQVAHGRPGGGEKQSRRSCRAAASLCGL